MSLALEVGGVRLLAPAARVLLVPLLRLSKPLAFSTCLPNHQITSTSHLQTSCYMCVLSS